MKHFLSQPKPSKSQSILLLAAGFILPAIASRAARHVSRQAYQTVTKRPAPLNPAAREVTWKEALVWSAAAGAIGGLARVTARRFLADTEVPTEGDDFSESIVELRESA